MCVQIYICPPRDVWYTINEGRRKEVTVFINRMSQHISKGRKSGNIWAVASRIFRDGRLISCIQIPAKERKWGLFCIKYEKSCGI